MTKKMWSLVLAASLVAGVLSAVPASAQTPVTAVPASVSLTDPFNDANYLNDQGGTIPTDSDDNVTPADAGSVSDLGAVWFSNTAETVSVHFQTQLPAPATTAIQYRIYTSPGEGSLASNTLGCLRLFAVIPGSAPGGGNYQGKPYARLHDICNVGSSAISNSTEATYTVDTLADGTGVVTITAKRADSPLLAEGQTLTKPYAETITTVGGDTPAGSPTTFTNTPKVDTTKIGLDYVLSDGSGAKPEPDPEPTADPGKPSKPEKPTTGKDCGKKKSKGKGAKKCPDKGNKPKPPAAPSCPPYVPGEQGAEAATSIVTAAATEEKPLEVTITAPPGVPEVSLGKVFQNIQVDTAGAEAGLYVRYEFPVFEDHDLYLNYADGSEAARAAGFNPTPVAVFDGTGDGGHSEQGAEMLDGIRSADCAGYTLDMSSFASEGGEMTLLLWLGEPQNDPAPPGGGTLSLFYGMTGLRNPSA